MTGGDPGNYPPVAAAWHPALEGRVALFLFPDEAHCGLCLPHEDLRLLSGSFSPLYTALTEAVAAWLGRRLGLPAPAAAIVARENLVPIAHFHLERLVRLHRLAAGRGGRVAVFAADEQVPNDLGRFRSLAQGSLPFNQALLARHARTLSLPVVEPPAPLADKAGGAPGGGKNYNLAAAGPAERLRRALGRVARRALSSLGFGPRPIAVLSMAYNTEALKSAGFYGGLLESVQGRAALTDAPPDGALRKELAAAVLSASSAVAELLEPFGLGSLKTQFAAAQDLAGFAAAHFPTAMLEAAPANIAACAKVLGPFARRPLVLCEANTPEPTFMMAAAKALGMEVVGAQYGGHQGYIEQHAPATDGYFPFMDRYLTWGWDSMPGTRACARVKAVPMPNPWLSESRRRWEAALSGGAEGAGLPVLFMSNRLYRFPPAPSGVSTALPDRIGEVSRLFVDIVRACAAEGIDLLHKPYAATARALGRTLAEMEKAGGSRYRLLDSPDKGMDPETLRSCSCVLWDVPGTGFAECLAAGIPTIACWPRLYNREEKAAAPLFRDLEAAGLVPRDLPSLVAGLKAVRASPRDWLSDRLRESATRRFLRSYAWADPAWAGMWRGFLSGL